MSTAMRPIDRIQEIKSAVTVGVATANRDACFAVCILLLDALDNHELALVPVAPQQSERPTSGRAFPARYHGRCGICGGVIELEDMIVRAQPPRVGVDHQGCAQ